MGFRDISERRNRRAEIGRGAALLAEGLGSISKSNENKRQRALGLLEKAEAEGIDTSGVDVDQVIAARDAGRTGQGLFRELTTDQMIEASGQEELDDLKRQGLGKGAIRRTAEFTEARERETAKREEGRQDRALTRRVKEAQIRSLDRKSKAAQAKAKSEGVGFTPGQKKLDQEFAKTFSEFSVRGGAADVQKGLSQLREASDALSKSDKLTGPIAGLVPDAFGLRARFNPESKKVQDAVEEVVQRNLRLILGAQFTEQEGKRLIERAFNPNLEEGENKKRVDRLINQIQLAADAKQSAGEHFEKFGTLKNFKTKVPTLKDIERGVVGDKVASDIPSNFKPVNDGPFEPGKSISPVQEASAEQDLFNPVEPKTLSREQKLQLLRQRGASGQPR